MCYIAGGDRSAGKSPALAEPAPIVVAVPLQAGEIPPAHLPPTGSPRTAAALCLPHTFQNFSADWWLGSVVGLGD